MCSQPIRSSCGETPPFQPRRAEASSGTQLFGRGTADDKGQLMTFVEACRAFRDTGGLPCHVTVLLEGEEGDRLAFAAGFPRRKQG